MGTGVVVSRDEVFASAMRRGDPQGVDWLRCALGLDSEQAPFPWQIELLRRFCRGEVVSSLDIPTGLGKTAVMAVWLVARALGASLPRRLVYVVDRRAVVDQATESAEALYAWVAKERRVADALGLYNRPLPISTLRGQHVDNRAWIEDPSSTAIIVGTVDMVGSRLLFSGYGVSPRMRPYHAGLLGADALVVLDEAHLVPAFEELLRQVERGTDSFGPHDPSLRTLVPQFRLLSLSATGRQTDSTTLTLSDDDRSNPVARKRLAAKKALTMVDLADVTETTATSDDRKRTDAADEATKEARGPKLADVLARQAWQLTAQGYGVRCLVFCNARKDAIAVAAALRNLAQSADAIAPTIELLVGGRRVKERTQARDALSRLGFLAGTGVNMERPAFLIATSAGEVGVDLDADHMVCDLVAWERMVQRLGRVNRRGDGEAKVVVVAEAGHPDEHELRTASYNLGDKLPKEQKRTLELFDKRNNATTARARLKQTDLSTAETKKLKKQISAYKDDDAKKLATYEANVAQHRALQMLLGAVKEAGGGLSPESLLQLRQQANLADKLRAAMTVEPLRPELTRALVDAWSMTSLDEHPGRPEIDPWLRGFRPNDPPQTIVVWRRHLPVGSDGCFDAKAAKRFFEVAPPHTSEQLETETHLVLGWLIERAAAISKPTGDEALLDAEKVVAIALGRRGEPKEGLTLGQIAAAKSKGGTENKETKKTREQNIKQLERLLVDATLVVDARLGGLIDGLLSEHTETIAEASDDGSTIWIARPDIAEVPVTGFRIRVLGDNKEDESAWRTTPGAGWVRRHLFVTKHLDGEPAEALVIDGWAGDTANEEERSEAVGPQQLEEHQTLAEDCARQIARRLGIEAARENLLAFTARLHDEGKRAPRWQLAFNAPKDWRDGRRYAKTKGPIDFGLLDGYRHELGSMPYVEAHNEFKALATDDQDLVLHLLTAHHGFARPVIGTSGCDDAPPSIVEQRARAVALRFARLSRRWGPWGLAWWEALLRSADQTASRHNRQAETPKKERP